MSTRTSRLLQRYLRNSANPSKSMGSPLLDPLFAMHLCRRPDSWMITKLFVNIDNLLFISKNLLQRRFFCYLVRDLCPLTYLLLFFGTMCLVLFENKSTDESECDTQYSQRNSLKVRYICRFFIPKIYIVWTKRFYSLQSWSLVWLSLPHRPMQQLAHHLHEFLHHSKQNLAIHSFKETLDSVSVVDTSLCH